MLATVAAAQLPAGAEPWYAADMRLHTVLPSLMFLIAACPEEAEDTEASTTDVAESYLGGPCRANPDGASGCAAGLKCASSNYPCDIGYCVPVCKTDADCPSVDGVQAECQGPPDAAACIFFCIDSLKCPSSLEVPTSCVDYECQPSES